MNYTLTRYLRDLTILMIDLYISQELKFFKRF